jgi:hypothetical protein
MVPANRDFICCIHPWGKSYVDSAFNDLDKIEQKHQDEVNKIVSNAYSGIMETTKSELSVVTAQ